MDVDNVGDASSPLLNQDILTMELILPARIASSVNCRPKTSARHAASFGASSEAGQLRVATSGRSNASRQQVVQTRQAVCHLTSHQLDA